MTSLYIVMFVSFILPPLLAMRVERMSVRAGLFAAGLLIFILCLSFQESSGRVGGHVAHGTHGRASAPKP